MPPGLQVTILVLGVLVMIIAVLIPVRLALLFRREAKEEDEATVDERE